MSDVCAGINQNPNQIDDFIDFTQTLTDIESAQTDCAANDNNSRKFVGFFFSVFFRYFIDAGLLNFRHEQR